MLLSKKVYPGLLALIQLVPIPFPSVRVAKPGSLLKVFNIPSELRFILACKASEVLPNLLIDAPADCPEFLSGALDDSLVNG